MRRRWDENTEWRTPDGRVIWVPEDARPVMVEVHFTDGTVHPIPMDLGKREVSHVEIAGKRYEDMGIDMVERYRGGVCWAVDIDGVRYIHEGMVPTPEEDLGWMGD